MFSKTVALLNQSLRSEERKIGVHVLRGAAAAAVLILVLVLHMADTTARMVSPGFLMIVMLSMSLLGVTSVAGAFYFPSSITEEKERGSIGLLRMANIGPATLLAGKSLSRLCSVMLLLALSLPYWWLGVTLGGMLPWQVASAAIILLAHLILMSQIGTFCSVVCRSTDVACMAAVLIIAMLLAGPYAIESAINTFLIETNQPTRVSLDWLQGWFAPMLMREALRPGSTAPVVPLACLGQMASAAGLFGLSCLVFDHFVPSDTSPVEAGLRPLLGRLMRRSRRPLAMAKPRPPRRAPVDAVAWKDFQQFTGGERGLRIRTSLLVLGFCALTVVAIVEVWRWRSELPLGEVIQTLGGMVCVGCCYVVGLELYFQSAFVFQRELRDQTWDSLRMLPMTLGELCRRKLAGVARAQIPATGFLAVGLVMAALGSFDWRYDFALYWREVLSGIVFAACAVVQVLHLVCYFSLRTNPWAGMALAYFTLGATVTGPLVLLLAGLDLERKGMMYVAFLIASALNVAVTFVLRREIIRMLRGERESG